MLPKKGESSNSGVLVDTCCLLNIVVHKQIIPLLSSLRKKAKLFVISKTYGELARIISRNPQKFNGNYQGFRNLLNKGIKIEKIDECKPEIVLEAKKLYKRYGLIWELSYVDCLYIATAKVYKLKLMSSDRTLLEVAEREGVNVIPMYEKEFRGKRVISLVISSTRYTMLVKTQDEGLKKKREKSIVTCPHCGGKVKLEDFSKHVDKTHRTRIVSSATCVNVHFKSISHSEFNPAHDIKTVDKTAAIYYRDRGLQRC
jgi:rRNA-processing protein FCF1/uncharacterized C2H2 Zn-finger protein